MGRKEGRWQLIIVSVYVHCKTHRKRSGIEMNETLNLHRQRTKWTADIELDNIDVVPPRRIETPYYMACFNKIILSLKV